MPDLSPMPEPKAEEPQLHPGGPDALELDPDGEGLPRDLEPERNPASDALPAEVTQPDDKEQAPTGKADEEAGTQAEAPAAGQTAEDGSAEPPA